MLELLFLAPALAAQAEPRVIARLEGDAFARAGIVAELIERPRGVSDEAFAQRLVDAEGLKPWADEPMGTAPAQRRVGSRAMFAGDGRAIIVNYRTGNTARRGRVCRQRLAPGPMSGANWAAHRWCASKLGLKLPKIAPPIIRTNSR